MFNCPINGSQVNQAARLYKRFTPTESVQAGCTTIRIENNYYVTRFSFAWVEADDRQMTEERPKSGILVNTEIMHIKFHGRWKPRVGAVDEPEIGDILDIGGDLWVIESGGQRIRKKSMNNFATVYLPLRKIIAEGV